jgi:hypothetical protein
MGGLMTNLRVLNRAALATVVLLAASVLSLAREPADVEQVRLNQLQFVGTHNSYHVRDPAKPNKNFPDWNYSHAPLDFPNGEAQTQTGFVVEFAQAAPARINPINGPEGLRGRTLGR